MDNIGKAKTGLAGPVAPPLILFLVSLLFVAEIDPYFFFKF